jgi:hypothetical protein
MKVEAALRAEVLAVSFGLLAAGCGADRTSNPLAPESVASALPGEIEDGRVAMSPRTVHIRSIFSGACEFSERIAVDDQGVFLDLCVGAAGVTVANHGPSTVLVQPSGATSEEALASGARRNYPPEAFGSTIDAWLTLTTLPGQAAEVTVSSSEGGTVETE